ncbi:hypothetical protein LEMLEM_LOCUS9587 [Lemmus lemmus]
MTTSTSSARITRTTLWQMLPWSGIRCTWWSSKSIQHASPSPRTRSAGSATSPVPSMAQRSYLRNSSASHLLPWARSSRKGTATTTSVSTQGTGHRALVAGSMCLGACVEGDQVA